MDLPSENLDIALVVCDGRPLVDQRDGQIFSQIGGIAGREGGAEEKTRQEYVGNVFTTVGIALKPFLKGTVRDFKKESVFLQLSLQFQNDGFKLLLFLLALH